MSTEMTTMVSELDIELQKYDRKVTVFKTTATVDDHIYSVIAKSYNLAQLLYSDGMVSLYTHLGTIFDIDEYSCKMFRTESGFYIVENNEFEITKYFFVTSLS